MLRSLASSVLALAEPTRGLRVRTPSRSEQGLASGRFDSGCARTFAAVVALSFAIAGPAAAKEATTGFDSITTPGRAVEARARFERSAWRFWRPDIRGAGVTITVNGTRARARTDEAGIARTTVRPGAVGVYSIEARLDGTSTIARSRLFVLDPNRPSVLVDLDQTVSDMPLWQVPLLGGRASAYPNAVATLTALARTHHVIYLTARDDHLDGVTRAFLARHAFPDGPVVYNDLGIDTPAEIEQISSKNHGEYKLEQILRLKARGVRIALGLGNTSTDAFAHERARVASYIFDTPLVPAPVPPPSVRFASWGPDLRGKLVRDGHLAPAPGLTGALAGAP